MVPRILIPSPTICWNNDVKLVQKYTLHDALKIKFTINYLIWCDNCTWKVAEASSQSFSVNQELVSNGTPIRVDQIQLHILISQVFFKKWEKRNKSVRPDKHFNSWLDKRSGAKPKEKNDFSSLGYNRRTTKFLWEDTSIRLQTRSYPRGSISGVEEVSDSHGEWEPMIKQPHEELAWGEVLDPEKQLSILEPIV
jgi:hypothetical protein